MTKILTDERGVDYIVDVDVTTLNTLAPGWALCGTCHRAWNDEKSTSVTPTPAGRCPFEDEHEAADEQQDVVLDPGAAEHLGREISNSLGAIKNRLHVRKAHPSYGVTKASLRADLSRVEGALGAYGLLLGHQNHLQVFLPALEALGLTEQYKEVRDGI